MAITPHRVEVVFYRTVSGADVVLDWLRAQDAKDRAIIGQDLARVQCRWPVGMPLCRPLGDGLLEVRSNLTRGRIARVFFCFDEGRIIALHAIIKKTQKTPPAELEITRKRQREFQ